VNEILFGEIAETGAGRGMEETGAGTNTTGSARRFTIIGSESGGLAPLCGRKAAPPLGIMEIGKSEPAAADASGGSRVRGTPCAARPSGLRRLGADALSRAGRAVAGLRPFRGRRLTPTAPPGGG